MSISRKDVEHIAKLARIELSERELATFEKDLSDVLNFVGKLNEVDTASAAPLTGGTDLINSMRKDAPDARFILENADPAEVAELVKAAPVRKDGYIKVRSVF
ncbi:MAG: hypothetical protein A3I44_05010 [Candidatus Sungbacteria bacterium RIFCSPLOWO2_02_FULL_51_17]|nr:MAG: hypothetical protein A2676_03730 [Candidatus Sungbacteria bacterium RIFCSPHIGHO2_01_FULL_51_22]OHA05568.1 MAG: hypothetical protein A3B29_02740 [Candidatus Sungbacteria bacterium RIFCSPLOWO2_01_FULL_51_34]OHA11700.1 MAG: hypothetical protein A3I44_05010 [Candidatus Sungbacteria bacterium RIFCSPLOWO2_02_FULL_51_17]